MSQLIVNQGKLTGEILIPPSKSHTLRSILFASLADGKSLIQNYLDSPDSQAMIEACRLFGAYINIFSDRLEIIGVKGKIKTCEDVINAGNSGLVLRFCTAIAALGSYPIVITGDHSIRHQRPMNTLLDGLSQLGVSALSTRGNGFAPLIIQGPIKAGKICINGEDSQPVSALLIASSLAEGPVEISVRNPGEKPWIALTLNWFDRLGIPYKNNKYTHYHIPGNFRLSEFSYTVPGDLSSAAFPIAAALVTGSELIIKNVDINDVQGDKELIQLFQQMGAKIECDPENKCLYVRKGCSLKGIKVDINNCIDAITILSVVACFAEGKTIINNGAIAKQKECNRIKCIASELAKMGAKIQETDDGLIIESSNLKGAFVNSYDDHRMAMSLAVAALAASGETVIASAKCISKTYPTFMKDFQQLGAPIRVF